MTDIQRHFPIATRAAVVAALLVLVSVAGTVAGAAPPSKEDVERARSGFTGSRTRSTTSGPSLPGPSSV